MVGKHFSSSCLFLASRAGWQHPKKDQQGIRTIFSLIFSWPLNNV